MAEMRWKEARGGFDPHLRLQVKTSQISLIRLSEPTHVVALPLRPHEGMLLVKRLETAGRFP